MFRCIIYIKPTLHATGEMGYAMSSTPFPTWDAANMVLEEWYASKCVSKKFEVCGGSIEQKVDGIGWVVCEVRPEEYVEESNFVVVLGPKAAWE